MGFFLDVRWMGSVISAGRRPGGAQRALTALNELGRPRRPEFAMRRAMAPGARIALPSGAIEFLDRTVSTDPAGNIKPVKPDRNRGSKRIDGIVSTIMAIGRESLRGRTKSVYERRGLQWV